VYEIGRPRRDAYEERVGFSSRIWDSCRVREHFRQVDRQTLFLMPPSLDDWLPRDHLARFVVEVVGKLDLRLLIARYDGRGVAAHHPEMMVALLFCGTAVLRICDGRDVEPSIGSGDVRVGSFPFLDECRKMNRGEPSKAGRAKRPLTAEGSRCVMLSHRG